MLNQPTATHIALLSIACLFAVGCSRPDAKPSADNESFDVERMVEEATERLNASEGGQQLLHTIEAHGGLSAWYSASTSSYTWEYANVGADLQFKSFLVADNKSRLIYHDLLTIGSYGDPQPIEGRFAWNGEEAWIFPQSITRINPRFWASTGYYFEQIPFVLADPGISYEMKPDEELDGIMYNMVKVSYSSGVGDSSGDTYLLYINKDTDRVDAIRYTVTYGREGPATSETLLYYEDYASVDGLTVPKHFRGYLFVDGKRGEFKNEAWADSISFSRPFDSTKLVAPDGALMAPDPGS